MTDRFFGHPGCWKILECPSPVCGLAWLSPVPSEGELREAYSNYYTHAERARASGVVRALYDRVKRSYLARKFGYGEDLGALSRLLSYGALLVPEKRHQMAGACLHLHASQRGRVLEVGCGNGNTLAQLTALGWEAWGLDFDPVAVARARASGATDVRVGTLEEQRYEEGSFDVVGSVHVLEHVPDPRSFLAETSRVLRPGGTVVVSTPNWKALTHRVFGPRWRGLEAPRHLHLFARTSLTLLLEQVGFEVQSVTCTARGAMRGFAASAGTGGAPGRRAWGRLAAPIHSLRVEAALRWDPDAGDELLAIARRPSP